MIRLVKDRRYEWPIVKYWYTKKAGQSIQEIIDTDVSFFEWAVSNFQNVTPLQADYYFKITGEKVPILAIQNVIPYEWKKGDSDKLYMELCETQQYDDVMYKYRGAKQLNLFD